MKVVLLMISSILISGCGILSGHSQEYPIRWDRYDSDSDQCQNISGKYLNVGDEKYQSGLHDISRKSLGYRLLGFHAFEIDKNRSRNEITAKILTAHIVEITHSKKLLSVNLTTTDGTHYQKKWRFKQGEITCSAGWLWVPQGNTKAGDGTGGHYNTYKIGIRKTNNGSLVAQEHNSMVGAVLWVLPIFGNQVMWYKWHISG